MQDNVKVSVLSALSLALAMVLTACQQVPSSQLTTFEHSKAQPQKHSSIEMVNIPA